MAVMMVVNVVVMMVDNNFDHDDGHDGPDGDYKTHCQWSPGWGRRTHILQDQSLWSFCVSSKNVCQCLLKSGVYNKVKKHWRMQ